MSRTFARSALPASLPWGVSTCSWVSTASLSPSLAAGANPWNPVMGIIALCGVDLSIRKFPQEEVLNQGLQMQPWR